MTEQTVASIAAILGGSIVGDHNRRIVGVADLRGAGPQHLGFVRDAKYREAAKVTKAGALICSEELETQATIILVPDVSIAYAKAAQVFHPVPRAYEHRIHPTAVVHPEAELTAPVEIGPHTVVGKARLGAGTLVMPGAVIGDDCVLGVECVLFPNVVLYHGVRLGDRVVVHAGTVIGADGFGYAKEKGKYLKLPQLGTVAIGDDVEIGANCTIDRGAVGDTRIGTGSKIDNLVHLAHNVVIGRDNALAAGCMIGGSTTLGDRVTFAGHVVTAGHLHIADDVRLGGNSGLLADVEEAGDYMGYPLLEKRHFVRQIRALRDLITLHADVEELKRRVGGEPAGD